MKLSKIFLALCISAILTSHVFATSIVVIVHPSNPLKDVSKDEIKRLFLAKTDGIQKVKLKPIAQNSSQSIRVVFDEDILGKTPSKAKAYWSRLVFTAAGMPPPELGSNGTTVQWVSENPDAIAYVEESSLNDTVKVLKKF